MSTRRIRFGNIGSGQMGALISKVGYDALTASSQNLLLGVSERYSNLLKLGVVNSSSTVALGFGVRPTVMITGIGNLTGIPDVAWPSSMVGPIRPSPHWFINRKGDQTAYAVVASDGSSMTIYSPTKVWYAVYSRTNSI